MPDNTERKYRHFILDGYTDTERFKRPKRKIEKEEIPLRDRQRHGSVLLGQIDGLRPELETARRQQEEIEIDGGFGLQVEFESFPDIDLAFESLARERSGIELFNVRHDEHRTYATVFVPDGKLGHFERLIRDYYRKQSGRIVLAALLLPLAEKMRFPITRPTGTNAAHNVELA